MSTLNGSTTPVRAYADYAALEEVVRVSDAVSRQAFLAGRHVLATELQDVARSATGALIARRRLLDGLEVEGVALTPSFRDELALEVAGELYPLPDTTADVVRELLPTPLAVRPSHRHANEEVMMSTETTQSEDLTFIERFYEAAKTQLSPSRILAAVAVVAAVAAVVYLRDTDLIAPVN